MAITVEAWQLVVFAATLLITVFSVYGKIIKENDGRIETNRADLGKLHGRLYGEDRGESGDINNIKDSVETIAETQNELCSRTRDNAKALHRIEATQHFMVEKLTEEDLNGDLDAINSYYDRLADDDTDASLTNHDES